MILHSKIIGSGRPFLILHGFFGMGDNWKSLANKFADNNYEVHLIDQRNHGRSFHSDDFNYQVMAEDVLQYCNAHQLTNVVLLGHSMGGKTAMTFAVNYPAFVSKLLVADIAPKQYPQHHQYILKGLSVIEATNLQSRGEADKILSAYIEESGIRLFLLKNLYWKNKEELALRINLSVLTEKIEEVGKPLQDDGVFNGETMFFRGEKSNYIEDFDEVDIVKHFPNATLQTISKAGHWLHAENPQEFYTKVMDFLYL